MYSFTATAIFPQQLAINIILALFAGIVIECIQLLIGRNFSYTDMAINILGAISAYCWLEKTPRPALLVLRMLTAIALLILITPIVKFTIDERRATSEFPVLADFSQALQQHRFVNSQPSQWKQGELLITFGTEKFSLFSLDYFPRDWRGYDLLVMEIENPESKSLELSCRIHDFAHNQEASDRFNQEQQISPGNNRLTLSISEIATSPAKRQMSMDDIASITCFTRRLNNPRKLILKKSSLREAEMSNKHRSEAEHH